MAGDTVDVNMDSGSGSHRCRKPRVNSDVEKRLNPIVI